jgi:hypothetical protein
MMTFPTEWENEIHVPNHQPENLMSKSSATKKKWWIFGKTNLWDLTDFQVELSPWHIVLVQDEVQPGGRLLEKVLDRNESGSTKIGRCNNFQLCKNQTANLENFWYATSGGFQKWGYPKNAGWFIMEHPI